MRMLDLSPYARSTVGFDRMFDLLENSESWGSDDNYPPYNIVKAGEESYRMVLAVAGFGPEELSVTTGDNHLVVIGKPADSGEAQYLHRGIAGRAFQRQFSLADYVEVVSAKLENGLLVIDLKREIPEALKPRTIRIDTEHAATRTIQGKRSDKAA